MATQVLALTSPHFSHGSEIYSTEMNPYSNFQTFQTNSQQNYLYDAEQPAMGYPSHENWANQTNSLRRMSSRSPSNQHDRTPIRHHKMSVSRSRSTSKPETLLAYATEQSSIQQPTVQRQSANTTPSLSQTTPSSSPAHFPSQTYSSISPASPYVSQSQFYDNPSPQYSNMHAQHSIHNHAMPDFYQLNRQELHVSPLSNASLSANNATYLRSSGQVRPPQMSTMGAATMNFPPMSQALESTAGGIEVSSGRNKPQCWDHGCNGRQFSTFSNLLRHQREKSGTAAKARCPHCNTEFTRTTARNGHMYGGKCKGLPDSTKGSPGIGDEATDD